MADVNQIITLGIGTPADIEHFLLVGLGIGEIPPVVVPPGANPQYDRILGRAKPEEVVAYKIIQGGEEIRYTLLEHKILGQFKPPEPKEETDEEREARLLAEHRQRMQHANAIRIAYERMDKIEARQMPKTPPPDIGTPEQVARTAELRRRLEEQSRAEREAERIKQETLNKQRMDALTKARETQAAQREREEEIRQARLAALDKARKARKRRKNA